MPSCRVTGTSSSSDACRLPDSSRDSVLVDTEGWAIDEVRRALADGYGRDAVDYGVGGSIPFISDLVDRFDGAQILVTGVEDPHSRAHSPNESLHIDTFRNAIRSEALLLARLNRRNSAR